MTVISPEKRAFDISHMVAAQRDNAAAAATAWFMSWIAQQNPTLPFVKASLAQRAAWMVLEGDDTCLRPYRRLGNALEKCIAVQLRKKGSVKIEVQDMDDSLYADHREGIASPVLREALRAAGMPWKTPAGYCMAGKLPVKFGSLTLEVTPSQVTACVGVDFRPREVWTRRT